MKYTDLESIPLTEAARVLNIAIHDGNTKAGGGREPCPFCGSSTGFQTRDNKTYTCYSCNNRGSVLSLAKHADNGFSLLRKAFIADPNLAHADYSEMEKIFSHYTRLLEGHPEIITEFCDTRQIDLTQVEVGYAKGNLQSSGYSSKQLSNLGLLSNKNAELWWDHLIFPIRDRRGLLTHFQGRALGNTKLRWLASRHPTLPISNCLYNLNKVSDIQSAPYYPDVFITEGITDALSLQQMQGKVSGIIKDKPFTRHIKTVALGTLGINPDISHHAYPLKDFSICFIYDNTKIAIGSRDYVQGLPNYRSWNSMLPCIIDFYKRRNSGRVFCLQVPEQPGVEDVNDFLKAIDWDFNSWFAYFKNNINTLEDFVLNYYKDDPKAMRLVGKCLSVRKRPEDLDEYSRLLKHHFGNEVSYLLSIL